MRNIKSYTFRNSSNLKAMSYNELTHELIVQFLSGALYLYKKVPFIEFERLKRAKSAGKSFHKYVRLEYDYKNVSK